MEYTGAIKSAKHLFGKQNLVLLPDTILTLPKNINLKAEIKTNLHDSGFTFLFKQEKNKQMLQTKGCLSLTENMRVLDYEDKPSQNLDRFDGYWCAFAFHRDIFDRSISFMEESTLKTKSTCTNIKETNLYQSKVIPVEGYKDLGTWDEITKLLSLRPD